VVASSVAPKVKNASAS